MTTSAQHPDIPVPIHAVIFDFGNVVCTFNVDLFRATIRPYVVSPPENEAETWQRVHGVSVRYESGRMTSAEYYREMCHILGLEMSIELFHSAFTSIFAPIEGTYRLVRLFQQRYKVGLLSNTNEWHFEQNIRTVDIFPLFHAVTLSYRVGVMKPERAIYDDMLRKLDVQPEHAVYIDDIAENVDGARKLGMQGCVYHNHERLTADLRSLGLNLSGLPE